MMCTTLDELIKEFQRHPQPSSGRLRLDHYLAMEASTEAANQFLTALECQGILPFTVTWVSEAGKVRLYQNPFADKGESTIGAVFFGMQFKFGPGHDCLVRNDDDTILIGRVPALPHETLKWFWILATLADYMTTFLPEPWKLGSEARRYRQTI